MASVDDHVEERVGAEISDVTEGADGTDTSASAVELPCARVDTDALRAWAEATSANTDVLEAIKASCSDLPAGVPLKFASVNEELNFWAVLHMLDFGCGYEAQLHSICDRVLFGMVATHITGQAIDAAWMSAVKPTTVAEFFNFKIQHDVQIMPAVYKTENNELFPFAEKLAKVLNETGVALKSLRFKDLGSFILSHCGAGSGTDVAGDAEEKKTESSPSPSASSLVERLSQVFSGFRDVHTVAGTQVSIVTKAQRLAAHLYFRFRETMAESFDFHDISSLCLTGDVVGVAVLRQLGIINIEDSVKEAIDTGCVVDSGVDAQLRAVAARATRLMARALESHGIASLQLSRYLLTQEVTTRRHAAPDSIFA